MKNQKYQITLFATTKKGEWRKDKADGKQFVVEANSIQDAINKFCETSFYGGGYYYKYSPVGIKRVEKI